MITDEKSKYKSWSQLKKQMQDLLCDSLKDQITYFYTSYHQVHNAYSRGAILYRDQEVAAFSWSEQIVQERNIQEQYRKMDHVPTMWEDYEGSWKAYEAACDAACRETWMPNGILCHADFIDSVTIFLKNGIAESLHSDNYLLRIFAYMDRRVGKRTLVKIQDEAETLPEWVQQFYRIRCEADGITFQK